MENIYFEQEVVSADPEYFEIPVFDSELMKDEFGVDIMETGQTEMIALVVEQNEILTNIRDDLHIVMFFVLFSFCWSCIRAWRKNFVWGCK